MQWISFKKRKPDDMCLCWVINIKRPGRVLFAIYNKSYDEFLEHEWSKTLDFPLEVSHYIVMPDFPKETFKKANTR